MNGDNAHRDAVLQFVQCQLRLKEVRPTVGGQIRRIAGHCRHSWLRARPSWKPTLTCGATGQDGRQVHDADAVNALSQAVGLSTRCGATNSFPGSTQRKIGPGKPWEQGKPAWGGRIYSHALSR